MLIHQVLKDDAPAPRTLNSAVPAEPNTIILKCLEKDPDRRYATALALAEDLRRWLNCEPILAKPAGIVTKFRKWIQRHPATAGLMGVIALAVVSLSGVGLWYQGRLSSALQDAELARDRADEERDKAIAAGNQSRVLAEEKSRALESEQRSRRIAEEHLAEVYIEKGRNLCGSGSPALGLHWFALAPLLQACCSIRVSALAHGVRGAIGRPRRAGKGR
jgi:hypothetical protein